jgi:3-dehydrotetronate 4-kinase
MIIGCIGDDFTGSSDIANTLKKGGMRVTQYVGIPNQPAKQDVQAGVVSLKIRTIPVEEAVRQSVEAAKWLLAQGCRQLFYKYCSTFDSTPEGNIGPVTEALAELTGEQRVVMCPAFPTAGRTVYQGHLFVFDTLLSESSMKDHPLTPMSDSDLRRWLGHQATVPVSHLSWQTVSQGRTAIAEALEMCKPGMVIADAISDSDLVELGYALCDRKLMTGGSGLAMGLPEVNLGSEAHKERAIEAPQPGKAAILSGSCSMATRGQIKRFLETGGARLEVDARDILEGSMTAAKALQWVLAEENAPLVFTSAEPSIVFGVQQEYGKQRVAESVEGFFAGLAKALVENGYRRIVTAGGETSGAVVLAIGVEALRIGAEIAPGVPAMSSETDDIHLALKSGNFGGENFFREALEAIGGN